MEDKKDFRQVGKDSLVYHPSKVSWSVSEYVARENPVIARLLIYAFFLLFSSLFAYSYFSRVPISLQVVGNLDYREVSPVIINKNDLTVDILYVKDGQSINEGDRLVTGKGQLTREVLKQTGMAKSILEKYIDQDSRGRCLEACVDKLQELSEKSFAFNPRFKVSGALKDYISKLSNEFKAYTNSLNARLNLSSVTLGLRNQISDLSSKIKKIERRGAQDILRMEYNQLKGDLANLRSQLKEKQSNVESSIRQNRNVLAVSLKNYSAQIKDYISSHQIKSPAGGVIVFLESLSVGQFLPARSKLFKILPTSESFYGKSLVSNKDISKLKVGDKVKISINSLPEREYGPVWGRLQEIAVDPKEDPQTKELKYEVLISLDRQTLTDYKGEEKKFKLGLSYEAKIITRYESLLRVTISKLLNIRDEYLGDLF